MSEDLNMQDEMARELSRARLEELLPEVVATQDIWTAADVQTGYGVTQAIHKIGLKVTKEQVFTFECGVNITVHPTDLRLQKEALTKDIPFEQPEKLTKSERDVVILVGQLL